MSRSTFHSETDIAAAYDLYADALFRHCYFRTFDREKGKELMLETFRRAWRFIADGNFIDDMRMFLYRAANDLVIDIRKDTDIAVASTGAGDEDRVLSALRRVRSDDRDAFIFHHIDGMKTEDAAEILGENPDNLARRAQRCMTALSTLVSNV